MSAGGIELDGRKAGSIFGFGQSVGGKQVEENRMASCGSLLLTLAHMGRRAGGDSKWIAEGSETRTKKKSAVSLGDQGLEQSKIGQM